VMRHSVPAYRQILVAQLQQSAHLVETLTRWAQ